jgi:signal transduction histidine kinase
LPFYGYAFVIVALALVLGWAGHITWQELRELHRSFHSMQPEAFQLSDHINASVNDLNNLLHRFSLRNDPEDRAAFQAQSRDLQQWMAAHKAGTTTPQEREFVGQIQSAFEIYTAMSTPLIEQRALARPRVLTPLALGRIDDEAAFILELNEKLRVAEHDAETRFMDDSRRALIWLQELLAVNLGLFIVMLGIAATAVYRGVIGPLRVKLNESRAIAARNEKLASLGTLAAGVAHEIRNPLTAINVRLHSLKKTLVSNSSEQEDALVIGHEIQRLDHIVQEFLMFARPADPKFLTLSPDRLFARMQSLFGPQFEKTSIRLNLESTPDIWVRVDPHQIEQVLINLIQNAAESMAHGGAINLSARNGTSRLNGHIRPIVLLEVSDTGSGIPPGVRQRIFDPFFTTKEEGTGLGLSIAARIVEKHGGALEYRSEVNRGTTFVILLPQTKPSTSHEPSS